MGAGKTAFAQGFGQSLGVTEPITSPTFTLVHSYDVPKSGPLGPGRRCTTPTCTDSTGRRRSPTSPSTNSPSSTGIVLVEWGDVVDAIVR